MTDTLILVLVDGWFDIHVGIHVEKDVCGAIYETLFISSDRMKHAGAIASKKINMYQATAKYLTSWYARPSSPGRSCLSARERQAVEGYYTPPSQPH